MKAKLYPHPSHKAHAFPIGIIAIDKYGLPPPLAAELEPSRSYHAVALVHELARITAVKMARALSGSDIEYRRQSDLARSNRYREVTAELEKVRKQRDAHTGVLMILEREVVHLKFRVREDESEKYLVLYHEPGDIRNLAAVKEFSSQASSGTRRFLRLWFKSYEHHQSLYEAACGKFVELSQELAHVLNSSPWLGDHAGLTVDRIGSGDGQGHKPQITFTKCEDPIDGALEEQLRQHDPDWWYKTTTFIKKQINHDLKSSQAKIMMRDPNLTYQVAYLAQKNLSRYAAETKVFKNPQGPEKPKNSNYSWSYLNDLNDAVSYTPTMKYQGADYKEGKLKMLKARLVKVDETASDWIHKHGGNDHPFDFYSVTTDHRLDLYTPKRGLNDSQIVKRRAKLKAILKKTSGSSINAARYKEELLSSLLSILSRSA